METFLFYLAAGNLLLCVVVATHLTWSTSRLENANDVVPLAGNVLPRISVIVAARNEERFIEPALQSLLKIDYDNLEIVVVNDRSTDGTAAILDRMAGMASQAHSSESSGAERNPVSQTARELESNHPRLRIIHLTELPHGWLGKNHALYRGASEATGEFLLFTDADIVMDPSVLRRAVAYMNEQRLDHLAMLFRVCMPGWLLESFVITFSVYFFIHFKPWKVRDPKSSAHIGVGGFNMLRAEAYRRMGTHQAIAMRPDDDIKLGKLVKKHGFNQGVLLAPDLMYVPWYSSIRELISGLEKNAFSGVDYSIPVTVGSSLAIVLFNAFPFLAVFLTTGATRWMYLGVVVTLLWMCANVAYHARLRMWAAVGFPLGVLLFAFIQWRTMILNLWQGGIRWRDTFYPLAELKANKV